MLFQVGDQGSRPILFKMAAAQQLPASLRAVLIYSIGFLHRVLDYEDEFFALLTLVLETHSLRTTDASFSESLYGLQRRAVNFRAKKDDTGSNSDNGTHSGLEKRQKILSVAFLVVLPYMKSKLHSIYNKEREARLQASSWGDDNEGFDVGGNFVEEEDNIVSRGNLDTDASVRACMRKRSSENCWILLPMATH